MMRKTALLLIAATCAAPAGAATLLFDFGSTDNQTADPGWNNVTYLDGNDAPGLTTVVDDTGATATGVSLVFTDQFYTATQPNALGSTSPGDNAAFPISATEDFFLGHTGEFNGQASNPTGAFKFTGLDANQTYTFTFFGSRDGVSDDRITSYTVTGDNQATGLLNTSNNDSQVLVLADITPDANNEILVSLSAGAGNDNSFSFYYINALQVDSIPEPSALALLALGGLIMTSRRRPRV